ncbi:MAG: hypothetical protein RL068_432, partial [Actinomycetota bacterium]
MSSTDNHNSDSDFGANEWLVAEMYGQWLTNPDSVDKSWWPILERYQLNQQAQPQAVAAPSFDSGEPTTGSLKIINTDSTVVQKF